MKVALVSCSTLSDFKTEVPNEDELLLSYLTKKGVPAAIVIWDDPNVLWESYDIVMVKSTWDYFNKPAAFQAWLTDMQQRDIPIYNSVDLMRWNMDKLYLKDIEEAGIPVIPTQWLDKGTPINLSAVMHQLGASTIIVKPRISGASKNTFKVNAANLSTVEATLTELLKEEDFMAQPFMEEVMEGEYSFLFFNGTFSHAVKKTPLKEDFRVQHYFGGSITPYTPSPSIKEQAKKVADAFATDCLYARVDGILKNNVLHIIELEVIEPMLYLHYAPNAFDNLLEALKASAMQRTLVS